MMGYFKPLRRKIGVMTLVLACVLTGGWVRSLSVEDTLDVIAGEHAFHEIHSTNSGAMWIWTWNSKFSHQEVRGNGVIFTHKVLTKPFGWQVSASNRRSIWISTPVAANRKDGDAIDYDYAMTSPAPRWYCNLMGFRFGVEGAPDVRGVVMTAHYWTLVIPLTLLSAWLLLSMPRQPKASTPEQITPS